MKYLFKVEYKDGTIFTQNEDDVSLVDPKRSAFFDIKDNIKRFSLIGEHIYTVDLTDGHFEIDGIDFKMHEEELKDFKLIYFRRHKYTFNAKHQEKSHEVVFRFGWQSGKLQEVMEIK